MALRGEGKVAGTAVNEDCYMKAYLSGIKRRGQGGRHGSE